MKEVNLEYWQNYICAVNKSTEIKNLAYEKKNLSYEKEVWQDGELVGILSFTDRNEIAGKFLPAPGYKITWWEKCEVCEHLTKKEELIKGNCKGCYNEHPVGRKKRKSDEENFWEEYDKVYPPK